MDRRDEKGLKGRNPEGLVQPPLRALFAFPKACRGLRWGDLKRQRKIILILGFVLVAVIALFLMPAKEEAKYEGKTISEWFNGIPVRRAGPDNFTIMIIRRQHPAFLALKKEAVPFLLHEMRKSDSWFHNKVFSLLNRLSGGQVMDDQERGLRVIQSFHFLGAEAKDAVPELTEIIRTHKNVGMAPQILDMIETAKKNELRKRPDPVLRSPMKLDQQAQNISDTDSNSIRKGFPMKIGN